MKVMIPVTQGKFGGEYVTTDSGFEVKADRDKTVLIKFFKVPEQVEWIQSFELMFCQRQHDPDSIKVIRKATDEEWRIFRVPLWIQGDEIPKCCSQPMFFVGQIDDDALCTERPKGAKRWWHDRASFYVFTCPQCLGVKAVGQQF